jgi:hypothetical protein
MGFLDHMGLISEGCLQDASHAFLSRARARKETSPTIDVDEDTFSPEAMTVDFSRVADEVLFASSVAIKKTAETLDD